MQISCNMHPYDLEAYIIIGFGKDDVGFEAKVFSFKYVYSIDDSSVDKIQIDQVSWCRKDILWHGICMYEYMVQMFCVLLSCNIVFVFFYDIKTRNGSIVRNNSSR